MQAVSPNPVFCAVDRRDRGEAAALVRAVGEEVGGIKLGKEFFTANGPEGVREVTASGLDLFLDLKFHDIPNTVASAVRAAAGSMSPRLLTVHASGGSAMIRAAADAGGEFGARKPGIVAVTVLTSLDESDLAETGVEGRVEDQVRRLADLAHRNGADGVVCSPREIEMLRREHGQDFLLVVPGIRPRGSPEGDQKRVMSPAEAYDLGADVLVIGRPITGAADPARAAREIVSELSVQV